MMTNTATSACEAFSCAFYNLARTTIGDAQPSAAHHEIAQWQQMFGSRLHIITQNVDDL